jgi:hypothetical protein
MNEARNPMICDMDDFLLIAERWVTDSAKIFFVLTLFDDANEPIFGFRLRGTARSVDKRFPAFTFLTGDGSEIVVALYAWSKVGYCDSSAYPEGEPVKEGFVIARPGATIAVWVPEP